MIRSSLGTDATHVNGVVHGDGLTSIQFRKERGGMTGEHTSRARAPEILQLERRGSQYILSTAQVGEPFYTIVVADLDNNDHVISFDGKKLGISHHAEEEDGRSIIYTIPFEGGVPERITSLGPSYLHGWSPDGEYLTYTAGRNGNYDICKISVNKKEEIRLTDAPGLDDGSEYSPDGKRIACISNSNLK
jgi:Tol biopolymer transport system component